MKCSKISQLLSAYVDNELTQSQQRNIQEHLKTCDACAHECDMIKLLSSEMQKLPQPTLPEDFSMSLHNKLTTINNNNDSVKIFTPRKVWISTAISAACISLVLGTGIIGQLSLFTPQTKPSPHIIEYEITEHNEPQASIQPNIIQHDADEITPSPEVVQNKPISAEMPKTNNESNDNQPNTPAVISQDAPKAENNTDTQVSAPTEGISEKSDDSEPISNTEEDAASDNYINKTKISDTGYPEITAFSATAADMNTPDIKGDAPALRASESATGARSIHSGETMTINVPDAEAIMEILHNYKSKASSENGNKVLLLNMDEYNTAKELISQSEYAASYTCIQDNSYVYKIIIYEQ